MNHFVTDRIRNTHFVPGSIYLMSADLKHFAEFGAIESGLDLSSLNFGLEVYKEQQ